MKLCIITITIELLIWARHIPNFDRILAKAPQGNY